MGQKMLPSRYFLCHDVFQQETDSIFRRRWLAAGRVSQLRKSGDFLQTTIEGHPLILMHAGDRVRCFHNVCRHRGAQLVSQSMGSLANQCLVCPYHGWTYSCGGHLLAAPNMGACEDFEPTRHGLHEVACTPWLGFLMVHLGAKDQPLSAAHEQLIEHFAPWQLESLVQVSAIEYDVAANWKLIVQNYSECYHCPTVHPALNRLTSYRNASNDLISGPFLGGPMQLNHGCETMATDSQYVGLPISTLNASQQRQVYYYVLFPNVLVSLHPDYVMAHRLQREAIDRTRVTCEFYFSPEAVDRQDFSPDRATLFWDEVNRQDWHVCELSQQGITSPAYEPGPYSPFERMLSAIDTYYLEALEAG